jgi:hypothetical protein
LKTLSDALLAAQKKADRLPYVEAKVYELELGIRRLSWTRLYEGSEPDNHHGIAFDGQGSMHRIRAEANNLYYQKIIHPPSLPSFPLSFPISLLFDYPDWQLLATDCQGPCAIAAYGAKVYIFYRNTSNVLRKYYSHDYGESWTDAQLLAYADVLSMAATWWVGANPESPTPIVVCFALQASELKAIVLDTSTQQTQETQKTFYGGGVSHYLDNSLGMGATYRPNHCEIVFAARELSTSPNSPYPYHAYHLWRTELDSSYNFLAIQSFLVVPDGESITYEYPDCHIPVSPQDYESTRILAVEKFTGATAYTRPLTCHAVRGSDFSSMAFTEPKPFLNISSSYGLRLQSTADYWWLERPDGVWRAPRPLPDPTDLTPDILSLTQQVRSAGASLPLIIVLDNSQGQYANPVALGLVPRSEVVLKLGYHTTQGTEAVEAGRYWIDAWEHSTTQQAQSTLTLYCLDPWGLADKWSARFQMRWPATKRVWEIIQEIVCRWGIDLTSPAGVPQSSAINNFYPDFTIPAGTPGNTALRQVLSFVPDALIFDGYQAYTKDLRADEGSCYSYDVIGSGAWQSHPILSGQYRQGVSLSRARAIGRAEDGSPIIESALDWDNLELGIDILATDYDPNLQTCVRTQERADAILRTQQTQGTIVVPTNCGQELYDVITLTDLRCGIDNQKHRVAAIQTTCEPALAAYFQRLSLGAP